MVCLNIKKIVRSLSTNLCAKKLLLFIWGEKINTNRHHSNYGSQDQTMEEALRLAHSITQRVIVIVVLTISWPS